MVILEEPSIQLVSDKQEALYCRLLQSSSFTKQERDALVKVLGVKIVTSYDASVFIDYLIAKIRYFKHFNKCRKHKIAECNVCGERIDLKRFLNIKTNKKQWLCFSHRTVADASELVEVPSRKKDGK